MTVDKEKNAAEKQLWPPHKSMNRQKPNDISHQHGNSETVNCSLLLLPLLREKKETDVSPPPPKSAHLFSKGSRKSRHWDNRLQKNNEQNRNGAVENKLLPPKKNRPAKI